jgi:hypothetical protein
MQGRQLRRARQVLAAVSVAGVIGFVGSAYVVGAASAAPTARCKSTPATMKASAAQVTAQNISCKKADAVVERSMVVWHQRNKHTAYYETVPKQGTWRIRTTHPELLVLRIIATHGQQKVTWEIGS